MAGSPPPYPPPGAPYGFDPKQQARLARVVPAAPGCPEGIKSYLPKPPIVTSTSLKAKF